MCVTNFVPPKTRTNCRADGARRFSQPQTHHHRRQEQRPWVWVEQDIASQKGLPRDERTLTRIELSFSHT